MIGTFKNPINRIILIFCNTLASKIIVKHATSAVLNSVAKTEIPLDKLIR